MIAPVDIYYYDRLKNRQSLYNRYDRYDFFYNETRILFSKLLRLIVENEIKLERLRQKLSNLPRFCIRNQYEKMDLSSKGYISKLDV